MSTIRLALFGSPVSQSPSPGIHKAFGQQFGLDVDYQLVEASRENFPRRLDRFRSDGGAGCNITLPLKHLACDLSAVRSSRAALAAAANTLWWDSGGRLNADNTDGPGLVRDLEKNLDLAIGGKELLLIGAGGAAAGVLGALLDLQPARLTIANRTVGRARMLADRHADLGEVEAVSLEQLDCHIRADLIIDATSLGHQGQSPQIPEQLLADAQTCYSLNYGPAADPLSVRCRELGVTFHSGWGMLVEQAACAFQIWTGQEPTTEAVLEEFKGYSN
jgi:shikimate dehydrogenase